MRCLMYIVAALVLSASESAAQAEGARSPRQKADTGAAAQPTPQSPAPDQKADSVTAAQAAIQSAPQRHSVSQFVLFSDGRPVTGATVILSTAGARPGGLARVATTDSVGRFTIDSLLDGSYDLRVVHPGATRAPVKVSVDGRSIGDIVVRVDPEPSALWVILVLLLYLATIILARWHNIARSLEEMLKGQLSALSTRLVTEVDPKRDTETRKLQETVAHIKTVFTRPDTPWWRASPFELMFWSRGRENAAWVAIHEVERQLAAFLAPPERVVSYLRLAHAQLRVINSPPAIAIAEAIRTSLPSQPGEATTAAQDAERKALLGHAIALCYADRDEQFATLMEWHNKAGWLILGALLIIGFLALAAGHAILFLAGAAGGFLSRVMRALRREDLPLDYGASWTTLFLSPLFGALAGWFGVAIITLATQPNVKLLGDAFKVVAWDTPAGPVTLAVAFLLGFSERFFDAVVGAVEQHAEGTKAAEEAVKAAGTAAPVVQGAVPSHAPDGAAAPPPSSAGGVKIDWLDKGPFTVQTVSGRVVLERPNTEATPVTLSTSDPDFIVTPPVLSMAAGEVEAHFDIVPKGNAPPGTVRVTARVGNLLVNESIDFE